MVQTAYQQKYVSLRLRIRYAAWQFQDCLHPLDRIKLDTWPFDFQGLLLCNINIFTNDVDSPSDLMLPGTKYVDLITSTLDQFFSVSRPWSKSVFFCILKKRIFSRKFTLSFFATEDNQITYIMWKTINPINCTKKIQNPLQEAYGNPIESQKHTITIHH